MRRVRMVPPREDLAGGSRVTDCGVCTRVRDGQALAHVCKTATEPVTRGKAHGADVRWIGHPQRCSLEFCDQEADVEARVVRELCATTMRSRSNAITSALISSNDGAWESSAIEMP